MQEVGDENKIEKRKVDKRTLYAIMVCLFISICLRLIWLFDISKISWIQPLIPYRKFILSFLLIGPVVYIVERASLSTLGFTLGDWKRTFIVTVLTSISVFLVGYLVALFWKHMGQLRIEGDMVYFVGNRLSPVHITPAVLYVLFLEQVSEVALPEEIIYRGYFQSRLSYLEACNLYYGFDLIICHRSHRQASYADTPDDSWSHIRFCILL